MREVARREDRITAVWGRLDLVLLASTIESLISKRQMKNRVRRMSSFEQWGHLPLGSPERTAILLEQQEVHIPLSQVTEQTLWEVVRFRAPQGRGWVVLGVRGWIGQGVPTFNTPTFELEPNDVSIAADRVYWKGSDGVYDVDAPGKVNVVRDGRGVVTGVTRR